MSPRRMINETVAIRFVVFTGLCNTPLVYYATDRSTSLQARAWRPTLGIFRLPRHKATPRDPQRRLPSRFFRCYQDRIQESHVIARYAVGFRYVLKAVVGPNNPKVPPIWQ